MNSAFRRWPDSPSRRWRGDTVACVSRLEVLGQARRIGREMAGGLTAETAAHAAPQVRDLLGADSVVLYGLTEPLAAAGTAITERRMASLAHTAAESGRPERDGDLYAAPLVANGDLSGVLVAGGPGLSARALDAVASWLGDALEWGRLESAREDLERAELELMRAQISPHFFANSLSAITSLIRSDPERARELLIQFAQYARYSMTSHGDFVTVAEEFRAIAAYLQLERARFGARLSTSVNVIPEVLPVTVPTLALQPLVENAIRHGIERHPGPGEVVVKGSVLGADCLITVEDDGAGMDPARAQEVLAGQTTHGGIGLANVDRRLRAVYGDEYGLVLETAPNVGTRVTVRVPRSAPPVVSQHRALRGDQDDRPVVGAAGGG